MCTDIKKTLKQNWLPLIELSSKFIYFQIKKNLMEHFAEYLSSSTSRGSVNIKFLFFFFFLNIYVSTQPAGMMRLKTISNNPESRTSK